MPALITSIKNKYFDFCHKLLFAWAKIDTPQGLHLPKAAHQHRDSLFFVIEHQSFVDTLVLMEICKQLNLPYIFSDYKGQGLPRFFGLRHRASIIPNELKQKRPSLESGELLRFSRDHAHEHLYLLPVTILWGRAPEKQQSLLKALFADSWGVSGRVRKLFRVLLHGRSIYVELSEPLLIKQLIKDTPDKSRQARKLDRILRVHFRRYRESIIGPDLSHRRTLVSLLIESPEVKACLQTEATKGQKTPLELEKQAYQYANEIASDFSFPVIRFLDITLNWVWNHLYDGIDIHQLERLRVASSGKEVIYVPCHRSHTDYLLLSYVLYQSGLTPPHIAAGINLNMPLIGPLLRRAGAFFMRRSFRENPVYRAVFNSYLATLFAKGFPVEYFIEGGRSRTGKTLTPKAGMLSMTLSAVLNNSHKPIVFCPVYIGYEKILEGGTFLRELKGKQKKSESIWDLISTIGKLRQNFGRVSLNFGQPVSLDAFLDQQQPDWRQIEHGKPDWFRPLVSQLANQLATEINKATVVNPINLLAMSLLASDNHSMDRNVLAECIETIQSLLIQVPYHQETQVWQGSGQEAIKQAIHLDFLQIVNHPLGEVVTTKEKHAVLLAYFRNNIAHLTSLPAFISVILMNNNQIHQDRLKQLIKAVYPFLQKELFLPWPRSDVGQVISQQLECMKKMALVHIEDQIVNICKPDSEGYIALTALAQPIRQTLERYFIVLSMLYNTAEYITTRQQLTQHGQWVAQKLTMLQGSKAPDFFDRSHFKDFIETLIQYKIIAEDASGLIEVQASKLQPLMEFAHLLLSTRHRFNILQVTKSPVQLNQGALLLATETKTDPGKPLVL